MVKDPKKIKYTFTYQQSDPKDTEIIERVPKDKKKELLGYRCKAPKGFRLWKRNISSRKKESVLNGGDFIPAIDPVTKAPIAIDAEKLNLTDGKNTFYLEATPGAEETAGQTLKMTVEFEDYAGVKHKHSDIVKVYPIRIDMAMDGNRDKKIDFDDPYDYRKKLFWVNDDCDMRYDEDEWWNPVDAWSGNDGWVEGDMKGAPDCNDDTIGVNKENENIGCLRDLEDFTRLHLRVSDNITN